MTILTRLAHHSVLSRGVKKDKNKKKEDKHAEEEEGPGSGRASSKSLE